MKPLMKLLMGITLGILLGASVDAAVGTFTFKTTGASDTVEAVSLVYPQRVPEAGSVTNDKLAEPISVANGGHGKTTAAEGLAALGGASLNGSSTVDFAASRVTANNHVINTDGYVRSTGAFVYSANIGSIVSGAARYIDFSLGSSGGFTSEVLTNMQFSVSKQAGGVWYSTAAYNTTTGLSGLTTLQTVDLDDSQLLTVTWSQPAVNTLRLTLTNTHTSTLYAVSVSVKVTSERASFMSFKAKG